jgi:hypothetical protein
LKLFAGSASGATGIDRSNVNDYTAIRALFGSFSFE